MNMKKIAGIEIWNKPMYIKAVMSFIDSITDVHRDMEYSRYSRMRYVIGEILERRIKNAYPGTNGKIEVELFASDTYFEVSIKDMGVPSWSELSGKGEATDDRQRLRNYIINSWMDEIGMEKLGKEGQRIYVRLKIKNPLEFRKPEPYKETEVLDENITIRPVVTEEDAIEAIRCIYSEYGYSYGYEGLYYQDSFVKMIENGEIMSFLAVNDHGQTAGHFALTFSNTYKNMPEISTVVIRNEFRGLRLLSRFIDYCLEVANEKGFRAVMAQPVAYHTLSQKATIRAGFTATSLLMGYLKSDMGGAHSDTAPRLDVCACIKIIDENAESVIYPPKPLADIISKQYDRLGWKYEFKNEKSVADNTNIKITNNSILGTKNIILKEASEGLSSILKEAIDDAIYEKCEMIELLIMLNNPTCEYGYETALREGFVLSGFIPGAANGDYIVMQMLMGTRIKYDNLETVGEFEELKNDIATMAERQNNE